jgi:uncharacterized protein YbjT (DUF2867 family)
MRVLLAGATGVIGRQVAAEVAPTQSPGSGLKATLS